MRFEKIWIEQCRATRAIKRRFGAKDALDLSGRRETTDVCARRTARRRVRARGATISRRDRPPRRVSFHEPFPAAGIGSGFSDRCLSKNRCVRAVSDIWPRALAAESRRYAQASELPLMFFHGVAAPEGSGPMTFSRLPETFRVSPASAPRDGKVKVLDFGPA